MIFTRSPDGVRLDPQLGSSFYDFLHVSKTIERVSPSTSFGEIPLFSFKNWFIELADQQYNGDRRLLLFELDIQELI